MQLTIDVSEQEVLAFGKEAIQHELENTLKWVRMKQLCRKIASGLQPMFDEETYYQELETIRESAWHEYKKDLD